MLTNFLLIGCWFFILVTNVVFAVKPPEMIIQDRNGVNMASGTPNFLINDVKIGSGSLTLSHSISSYSGYFYGYHDSFNGGVSLVNLRRGVIVSESIPALQVTIGQKTKHFKIVGNFTSFTDLRGDGETLVKTSNGYLYTQKDGTKVEYVDVNTSSPTPNHNATAKTITYPNGFKIKIYRNGPRIISVNTNNGLQLKWVYSRDEAPKKKSSVTNCQPYIPNSCLPNPQLEAYYERLYKIELWSYNFPTKIVAINNAIEFCDPLAAKCNLNNEWPFSQYEWPSGAPLVFFEQQNNFVVTDMANKKTKYVQIPFNIRPQGQSALYMPRISSIRDGHTDALSTSFHYENQVSCWFEEYNLGISCETLAPGVLKRITTLDQSWSYQIGQPDLYNHVTNSITSGPDRIRVLTYTDYGVPAEVFANETAFRLQRNDTNRVYQSATAGIVSNYAYDTRGNLTSRTDSAAADSDQAGQVIVTSAGYSSGCTNMKICNKAIWEKDGNGNQTDFAYHAESGQLSRVTAPAAANGIRPQTRYKYGKFYARYKMNSGSVTTSSDPIWLVTEQSYCKKGAAKAPVTGEITTALEGCSLGSGDEVKITYEYDDAMGATNLYMKAKVVNADNQTRRTCYEYDIYGNQIGETKPLGTASVCS